MIGAGIKAAEGVYVLSSPIRGGRYEAAEGCYIVTSCDRRCWYYSALKGRFSIGSLYYRRC